MSQINFHYFNKHTKIIKYFLIYFNFLIYFDIFKKYSQDYDI